jgi:hypothetical protein
MSRQEWIINQRRLASELDGFTRAHSIEPKAQEAVLARRLAHGLFLAHSTSDRNFSDICGTNRLRSPLRRSKDTGMPLDAGSVESIMGTANAVFFYAAPFRYPQTSCGFLFLPSLESEYSETGVATPFDSGGLLRHFGRPDPAETAMAFMIRHELPLPQHREYLQASLHCLFTEPRDYIQGRDPQYEPIGLTGGDRRRWTHEVRLPEQVFLRTGYLQAIFVPISRVADPQIQTMVRWCEMQGVEYEAFQNSQEDDFEILKNACVDYIVRKLL